eukprot:TRINITY_DN2199_c0_g1_i1.p1 TRINITY_DN2199_c0_g1~~TRINITY_DN2199_c0_g1_i1.p1  ORF type:complete len:297 (+),score=63.81 TRINITY_DN2199_c0_g1_i1:40-930(+)
MSEQMEDQKNLEYIREHKMHLLFERLAGNILQIKPKELVPFLIEVLMSMPEADKVRENMEKKDEEEPEKEPPTKYDPTQEDRGDNNNGKKLKVTVAVFGIAGAGKTTLLSAMGNDIDTETTPTVGFTPVRMATDKFDLVLYDLGGGSRIRGVWPNYFSDVHGIIYVVDGSDQESLAESVEAVQTILTDERTATKPILFFSNKQDTPSPVPLDAISQAFSMPNIPSPHKLLPICAIDAGHASHANIDEGLNWLLSSISQHYDRLSKQIESQLKIDKEKRKRDFEEKLKRVKQEKEAS